MSPGSGQRPPGTSARAGRLPSGRSAERRAAPAADPTPASSGRTAAIPRLSRSCRNQHSGSEATGPRLGRTAWRSRAGDSPSRGKRPRNTGPPAAGWHGPWPARRQSLAGRPPAPASLRPGPDPNRRCHRGRPAGQSPPRLRTTPRLPPRFPPASKPKPRIHPRSENERGNTRPPSHPQSRDGPVTSGAVPDLFQNNPTEISALYAWEDKLVDVIDVIDTQRNQFTPASLAAAYSYNNVKKERGCYLVPYDQGGWI